MCCYSRRRGVLVRGLPTTVFVLIASYCFSKSSPRVERWLRNHPWLGPTLRRLASECGLSRSAKRAALTAMWTAILVSAVVLAGVHWVAALATIASGVMGTLSILYGIPTVPERQAW